MDLRQNKLTKEEWCALEVPVDDKEKRILKLIYDSWEDPNISENNVKSYFLFSHVNHITHRPSPLYSSYPREHYRQLA